MTEARLPGEFTVIERYLKPLAAGQPGALGLADDAALLAVEPGYQIVVTADALVAGVHFLESDPPDAVARKMLRVNLSDLAAMGARPVAYFMTIAFPRDVEEAWIKAFTEGLAADQTAFGAGLMGGDITATPGPLTLSVTALGRVREGRALRRGGARVGDCVVVSGTIGDATLGLKVLRGELPSLSPAHRDRLADRYRLPRPRLELGQALAEEGLVTAALDVSDGLVADLGHICETSGCGAVLQAAAVPLSDAGAAAVAADPALRGAILAGGDDYELLATVSPDRVADVLALGERLGVQLAVIGRTTAGAGVRVEDEHGQEISLDAIGYRHF